MTAKNQFLTLEEFCDLQVAAAREVVDRQNPDMPEADRAKLATQVAHYLLAGWSEADNFGMLR